MYKVIFLQAFHGFFHTSYLLPCSRSGFNPSCHLTRGGVTTTSSGINVFIKWTKTLQRVTHFIPLASIQGSPLCPLQAITYLNQAYPVPQDSPMHSFTRASLSYLPRLRSEPLYPHWIPRNTDSTLLEELELPWLSAAICQSSLSKPTAYMVVGCSLFLSGPSTIPHNSYHYYVRNVLIPPLIFGFGQILCFYLFYVRVSIFMS